MARAKKPILTRVNVHSVTFDYDPLDKKWKNHEEFRESAEIDGLPLSEVKTIIDGFYETNPDFVVSVENGWGGNFITVVGRTTTEAHPAEVMIIEEALKKEEERLAKQAERNKKAEEARKRKEIAEFRKRYPDLEIREKANS